MSVHFLNSVRQAFARHSARTALEYQGEQFTYGNLEQRARRAAALLRAAGVAPGDRVVIATDDKLPLLVSVLATFWAGAAPLPLNSRYTREEFSYFLGDSQPKVVVAGETGAPLQPICAALPMRAVLIADRELWEAPNAASYDVQVGADDPALLMYSSGTTGWPKGIVHTQENVALSLQALSDCWRMSAGDVVVNVLPLFHIHGLAFATLLTWLAGGKVLIDQMFDPQRMMAAIDRATVCMAVPTIYYRLLEEPEFRAAHGRWPGVRLFTCGSAPIRAEILPELEQILGRPVINRYGMTEAFVITSLPLEGPWHYGSVGLPLEGVELRIAADDGSPSSAGEVGGVQVRSHNLFRRYWNKPEATAAAFVDGWFDTGDLGAIDDAGFLTLVGRKHDLIITHGFNVYPQVVERVIGECPGVRECAVLGVNDARRGESVAVVIVRADPDLNEATVAAWCSDRLIHYQQPRHIRFVDALPRNSLGKVLRKELRVQIEGRTTPE